MAFFDLKSEREVVHSTADVKDSTTTVGVAPGNVELQMK
jgi:hypothetical protein